MFKFTPHDVPVKKKKGLRFCVFKDRLYLASDDVVYVKNDKDEFIELSLNDE